MASEPNVHGMSIEIDHLKQGQHQIVSSIDKLSGKVDGIADALTTLIRHDGRIGKLESDLAKIAKYIDDHNKETEPVINDSRVFMKLATTIGSLAILLGGGFITWLVGKVEGQGGQMSEVSAKIARLEAHHESNRTASQ